MPAYRLAIPPHVAERIRHLAPDLKRAIREALRALVIDPGRGEPLKRELQKYLKYRVRRFRIVYGVDRKSKAVIVMAIAHRRSVYEETAAAMRPRADEDIG